MTSHHFVSIDPAMQGGEPCINHTGMTAEYLARRWWFLSDKRDCRDYDCIWPDVLVACWYFGLYGPRSWKKRFGAWAKEAHGALWKGEYAGIVDPPTKETTAKGAAAARRKAEA